MAISPTQMPTPEEAIKFFNITPDDENQPMVLFSNGSELTVMVLAGLGPGEMTPTLEHGIKHTIAEMGDPVWIILCAEAWSRKFKEGEYPSGGLRPGQLQAEHEAGADDVIEVVICNGISKEKEFSASQHFTRKDGEVIWDELRVMPSDAQEAGAVGGGVPTVLRMFFA